MKTFINNLLVTILHEQVQLLLLLLFYFFEKNEQVQIDCDTR